MSLLLLLRRVTKVFRPSKPVRGHSVMTSPENVFVVTHQALTSILVSEVKAAVSVPTNAQHAVTREDNAVVSRTRRPQSFPQQ